MKSIALLLASGFFGMLALSQASPVLKHQRLDFQQFEKAFFAIEAVPDLHVGEGTLTASFRDLREELRTPHSPVEQFGLYASCLAKVQCGHTTLMPSKAVIRDWGSKKQCLPFDVLMVNKKLFISPIHPEDIPKPKKGEPVVKEKPKKEKEKLDGGTEIWAIDQKTVPEWMALISPYIPSDENGMDFKYHVAGQLFDFYRYLAAPARKDSVRIDYIYKKDTLHQFVKLGYPPAHTLDDRLNVQETKKEQEKNFGTFSIEKNKYGYFRFESFKNSKGEKYEAFLKESFESMKKKKVNKLIIDLRGNTGGIIQLELLRYLVPSGTEVGKYVFEKKLTKKQLKQLGVKMREEPVKTYLRNMKANQKLAQRSTGKQGEMIVASNPSGVFKGEIVVITDEATFSAASILAAHLKTLCKAKIVGQPAGGSFYAGNAGTLPVKLKKSKLIIQLNPNFFCTQLYPEDSDPAIKIPDAETFSEASVPGEKFIPYKQRKKADPSKDDVIKAAEKQLK